MLATRSVLSYTAAVRASTKAAVLHPAFRKTFASTATDPNRNPEIYDVVCIGGGPAGLSLISSLQSQPATRKLRIALIDSQDLTQSNPPTDPELYSNRCSSLTPSSVQFLRETGAWSRINGARTQPYHGMDVWDGVTGSKVHFDPVDSVNGGLLGAIADAIPGSRFRESRREYEVQDRGVVATMCENANLTSTLLQCLQDAGQDLEILGKTRVESIQLGPEPEDEVSPDLSQWPIVTLSGGRHLAARLLVGADGANSPVRQFADIPSHGWDYNQHGVVATLRLDKSFSEHDLRTAYQRFLPTGPIALLPLPGNKASLVWSISAQHATALKQLPPESFAAMVNSAFRLLQTDLQFLISQPCDSVADELAWREPNTDPAETGLPLHFPRVVGIQDGTVASFPLRMRHASTYTGHRVALIGDAAHTIHPLAGQGLNLGLADARSLAKRVADGVENGMDIGSCWCLDEYNAERWSANNAMLGVVDKLHKLYSVSSGPVVWGRSLGLGLVDKLGPLKGVLMSAAAGR